MWGTLSSVAWQLKRLVEIYNLMVVPISPLQLVLRVAPWRALVRNLQQRPAIICPACGAAMVIAATMIARPPALAASLRQ